MDIIIHPEKAVCEEITRLVKHPYAVQVMDFESGRLTMLGLNIDSDCESLYDEALRQIVKNNQHFRFGVIAISIIGSTASGLYSERYSTNLEPIFG